MYNLDSRRLIDAKIIRPITRRAAALECFGHKPDGSLIDRPSQTVTDYERVR